MDKLFATSLLLTLLVSLATASEVTDECLCTTKDSIHYEGTILLDCTSQALMDVPTQCFTGIGLNISEFILSHNRLTSVRSTSLVDIRNLKVLMLDHNELTFFDETALEFLVDLQKISFDENVLLSLEQGTFSTQHSLVELSTIGSKLGQLPNVTGSQALERLDIRSSKLTVLPLNLVHKELASSSFYLSCHGNEEMPDVAAMSLLDLPDDSIITMDPKVLLWARTEDERQAIIGNPWTINIDVTAATKLCEVDGLPGILDICFG